MMFGFCWRVWFVALWGCLAAVSENVFYKDPFLICGEDHLEYSLQLLPSNSSTRLSVYDADGNGTPLITNKSCGTLVTLESDGSVVIHARYDGCYIHMMENNYTMTIFLEVNTTGEWEVNQKEDLMCPVYHLPSSGVKDAPSPSECSDIPAANKLACVRPPVSQEACLRNGCCYDPIDSRTPCYYGNRVTLQCAQDGMLSVAVSSGVTVPSLILSSVRFPTASATGCGPIAQNDAFVLFSFPLSACGTTQTVDGSHVAYENDLVANKDVRTWGGSSITRDSTFRVHIRCSFVVTHAEPLSVEVLTLPPPSPVSIVGPLNLEMRIALDEQYKQYYSTGDYPITKVLRDSVFVEVRILNRRDPDVVLMLAQCWATASMNPQQLPQWPILVEGCPFDGDNYLTQPVPVQDTSLEFPVHYKRFIVSTFTFVDSISQTSLNGLVYLHCTASACVKSSQDPCETFCSRRQRRAVNNLEPVTVVSSDGAIEFYMDRDNQNGIDKLKGGDQEKGHHLRLEWLWAVVAGIVFGIAILTVWMKKQNGYNIKNVV